MWFWMKERKKKWGRSERKKPKLKKKKDEGDFWGGGLQSIPESVQKSAWVIREASWCYYIGEKKRKREKEKKIIDKVCTYDSSCYFSFFLILLFL